MLTVRSTSAWEQGLGEARQARRQVLGVKESA